MIKIINFFLFLLIKPQFVILNPLFASINNSAIYQKFAKMFKMQYKNALICLKFQINHLLNYKIVIIDKEHLSQLFCNKTIINAFSTMLYDKLKVNKDDKN